MRANTGRFPVGQNRVSFHETLAPICESRSAFAAVPEGSWRSGKSAGPTSNYGQ